MVDDTTNLAIIFGRYPVPGKVKTRLAASLGSADLACDFYRACAERTILEACSSHARVVFSVADAADKERIVAWLTAISIDADFCCQTGLPRVRGRVAVDSQTDSPNLGVRMASAINNGLAMGAGRVVLMGTDIPDLAAHVIDSAFALLESFDVVLGDSGDGGYYLVGMKAPCPFLFEKIEYSTSSVYDATVQRAVDNGLRVADRSLLPTLMDIDYADDLMKWLDGKEPASRDSLVELSRKLLENAHR